MRDAIYAHVYGDPANEVGGLLAGDRRSDGVMVVGAVRAEGADGDITSLTFTHDSWAAMLAELEAQYPGAEIVGWYHSHPGHGIFLSKHDEFIHRNFFSAAWQFAIVVDPHHHDEGLFMWRDAELPRVAKATVDPRWSGAHAAAPPSPPPPTPRPTPVPDAKPRAARPAPTADPSPTRLTPRRPHAERTAEERARDREERARRRAEIAAGRGQTVANRERAAATARTVSVIAIGFGLGAVLWMLERL